MRPAPDAPSRLAACSARLRAVQEPLIPIVGQMIRDHPGTISLGQGVVHYGPPPQAIDRIARFLQNPAHHRYQLVQGIPELLGAIERKLTADNRISPHPDRRLLVTAGANMGFVNALLAIADPGDQIILLTPYYFNHEMAITIADCRPIPVPTTDDFRPDLRAIEAALTDRTRAIVTISPNNPSGAVYDEPILRAVNDLCRRRGLYHICDEPYEYFTYGGATHFSPASIPGSEAHTICLFSLSKAYGFASWRIGYMLIPAHLELAVKKIQDTLVICPPVVSQHAAIGALEAGRPWCAPRLAALADVRGLVLGALGGLSCLAAEPRSDGAFYALLTLDTDLPDMTIVERLVREHGVAVLPGRTFGLHDRCCLRIAYGALERDTVAEGVGRLTAGLDAVLAGAAS